MKNAFVVSDFRGRFFAYELCNGVPRSAFAPSFATLEEAQLFADFARMHFETELELSEREQFRIAAQITIFLQPILGIEISDVLDAAEILTSFIASPVYAEAGRAAA